MKRQSLAPFALALLLPGRLAAQEPSPAPSPPPLFPAQIELVTVDTVVTDKKGVPIRDLTRDEFSVFEDGNPQPIASFEAVMLPAKAGEAPPPRPRVATNAGPQRQAGRSFVVVFDDIHLTPFQAHRAKAAVAEFLNEGVREGDVVTLVATGGGAWWTARMESGREQIIALLKRLDGRHIPDMSPDRMTDQEAMRIHVYRDQQVVERVMRRFETYGVSPNFRRETEGVGMREDPLVFGRASEVYFRAAMKNRITLDIIERVVDSLAAVKGRKSLILVSEGFIYDPNLDEFKRVVEASRRANAAIYFLDTRGLGGLPISSSAEFGPAIDQRDVGAAFADHLDAAQGAESISLDSGGFTVKNTNDLTRGIQRIADESRAYYLLGYYPTNTQRDGRFRKIQVKVDRKGVQVRARKGYYAPLEGGKSALDKKTTGGDPAFQVALDSPYELTDIPLRLTQYVLDETILGKANVVVVTEVDTRGFAFDEQEDRFQNTLEFLLVVAHRESGEYYRYDQKVEMKLLAETRQRLLREPYPIAREFELAPGGYQAKMVVRDKNSGRMGTVTHDFEVPDLASLRTSTPVITDKLQTSRDGDNRPRPAMLARRTFRVGPGSMLYCNFEVFGAAKEKATGMPKVSAGFSLRRMDGTTFHVSEPTPIQPTSIGRVMRMVGTSLERALPGEYELVLEVRDELSGSSLEVREPFTLENPPAGG